MSMMDRIIAGLAPGFALRRIRSRIALSQLMHYEATTSGNRGNGWRADRTDADAASRQRGRLAWVTRDLFRNNAYARRGQTVIANNVVGDGIIPKVTGGSKRARAAMQAIIRRHLDTVAIDANGRLNLYGLQRLVINSVVCDGEVLIRRRRRLAEDGLALPFQMEVLEIDHLAHDRDGLLDSGNEVREGIEFDAIGRRVAYWIYPTHPGASGWRGIAKARRIPASEIIHIYRMDRPGQMRGVSWIAPVALRLQDLGDYQDAQLMRQKIAACFAAFIRSPENDVGVTAADGSVTPVTDKFGLAQKLVPGRIQKLDPGEDVTFAAPPGVEAYDEFTRGILREVAAGLDVTYEALTGDLSRVNFSSGRMGRMEMDRAVSAWQWLMMVPGMMLPLGEWIIEAFDLINGRSGLSLDWVPPRRQLIDPAREIGADVDKVKAGFASRQGVIREYGYDPEAVLAEIVDDQGAADAAGLVFETDARGRAQVRTAPDTQIDPQNMEPNNDGK